MPRFQRHHCSLCDGARSGDRFACWCPTSYSRAFAPEPLIDQPSPTAARIIMQVIAGPHYQQEHFFPLHASRVFSPGRGNMADTIYPNLVMTTLASMPPADGWDHFAA